MLALHEGPAVAGEERTPISVLGPLRAKRCDTLIASAVLVALIAGWVMNFVSVKQLSLGVSGLLAHAASRQT